MNTNRQKLATKSNNIVRSCQKQPKHSLKSVDKSSKHHTSSIKCHEEVTCMVGTQSFKPEYFNSHTALPYDEECKNIKNTKSKENNKKTGKYNTKPTICCESTSKQIGNKDVDLNYKSKSAPVLQNCNLEDSVDFIPVKLSNKSYGSKIRSQNHETKFVDSEKRNKNRGPTWDQLLKGESKIFHNNVENVIVNRNEKDNFSHHDRNVANANAHSEPTRDNLIDHNIETAYKSSYKSDEIVSNDEHVSGVIKSLRMLIEKQREMILKQPPNDNMNKIIMDIDNALLKICSEDQPKTLSEISSSVKSATDNTSKSSQSDTKQVTIAEWDIPLLKKNLEESCLFLQSLCIKQRENCSNHIREKEQLTIQLAESRRLVATAKSKEKEYEKTIGELRLKLQETSSSKEYQAQSLKELNKQVTKLKSRNKALESLNKHLKESSAEKEMLQSKLYLKDLEIEKLKVLLEVKPTTASNNKQKFEEGIVAEELKLDIPQDDKATLLSLPSESSLNLCKPRIICSSQASSSPRRSPSPYDSWQHISSIPQDLTEINELHNSMVRVFNIMKTDTEWCDSLELELEEPVVPSFYSEEDDEIKPKEINLGCGSIKS